MQANLAKSAQLKFCQQLVMLPICIYVYMYTSRVLSIGYIRRPIYVYSVNFNYSSFSTAGSAGRTKFNIR